MSRLLKRREQFLIYIIFALIFISFAFNLIISPLWQKNQELNREIIKTRRKLIRYQEVLNRNEGIEDNYPDSSPGLRAIEQKEDSLTAVLAELGLLSQKAGVKILDIRPQGTTKISGTKETSFDLRLEGSMEDYLKFIYEIENSVFLLRIKKIQLRSRTDSPSIEATFTIKQTLRI